MSGFISDQTEQAKILLFLVVPLWESCSRTAHQLSFCFGAERTWVYDAFIAKGSIYRLKSKPDTENKWNHPIWSNNAWSKWTALMWRSRGQQSHIRSFLISAAWKRNWLNSRLFFYTAAQFNPTEPAVKPMEKRKAEGFAFSPPSWATPLHNPSPRCLRIPSGWQSLPHVPPRKTRLGINNENFSPSEGVCGFGKGWHDRNLNAAGIYLHFTCSLLEASPHSAF